MIQKQTNEYEIEHFWLKLMTSSKSVNKIPDYYLGLAQNARLYDTGIWPRRWKKLFIEWDEVWSNNWAFVLKWVLYQIANWKIYKIDDKEKTRTYIWDTNFTKRVNIITYSVSENNNLALISSPWCRMKIFDWNKIFENNYDKIVDFDFVDYSAQYPEWSRFLSRDDSWEICWQWYIHIMDTSVRKITAGLIYWYIAQWKQITDDDWKYIIQKAEQIQEKHIDWWNIEKLFEYFFAYRKNILYLSPVINANFTAWVYNFVWKDTKRIYFDNDIIAIKSTMSGLYIFTEKRVHYLNNWSKTSYSTLWEAWIPINCFLLVSAWDKIIYLTKWLNIAQISYMEWTNTPWIWDLSTKANAWIKNLLDQLDENQDNWFAFYNERERVVQFHLKTRWSNYNDICFIYDLVNETWAVDTNRNYNAIIEYKNKLYWFSANNTNIYIDDTSNTDDWEAIDFKILTQALDFETQADKFFQWFFLSWWISENTSIKIKAYIDWENEFEEEINWREIKEQKWSNYQDIQSITNNSLFNKNNTSNILHNFSMRADSWSLNKSGEKIMIEIQSNSKEQNFILDRLGFIKKDSSYIQTNNKI